MTQEVRNTNEPIPLTPEEKLMTPEQKFFFDLRGWILLPSVLSESEIEEMKAEFMRVPDKVITEKEHSRTYLIILQL